MTQISSSTPTYDGNGNVTYDVLHSYSWDVFGKPTSIDDVGLTYDALGRVVEQNRSGTYTQLQYSPTGLKMQLITGATTTSFVPLPGGGMTVWVSAVPHYRHADWLGSSRLATTASHSIYFDGAYAPFGEPYAQSGTTDLSFTGMNQGTVGPSTISPPANTTFKAAGRPPIPLVSPPSIPPIPNPGTATPTR